MTKKAPAITLRRYANERNKKQQFSQERIIY